MDDFSDWTAYTGNRISATQIGGFAVPHIVVDDVLPSALVERINAEWPAPDRFSPEVPGNFIYQMYQRDYGKMTDREREFWIPFNEEFWPALVAAVAHAFSPLLKAVFQEMPLHDFTLEWPLTLAQASPDYNGIYVHSHFWHAPHWAFTVLLYIDPDDSGSSGTALHRFGSHAGESSYSLDDVDALVDVAMDQARWERLGQTEPVQVISYRKNRLFVMLDGPLAIHSVRAGAKVKADAVMAGRRRVLRCHAKVDHNPFYEEHARRLGAPFGPAEYMRLMDWGVSRSRSNADRETAHEELSRRLGAPVANIHQGDNGSELSGEDWQFRSTVLRRFYRERISAYAEAWKAFSPSSKKIPTDIFLWQAKTRLP